MGLWPKRCVAGTARRDFAGVDPREAWVASCRTVAGSLRCPCGIGEPCGRPVVAAFGQARPRGQLGNRVGPVGVALAGGSLQVTLCADVAAPEAAVAPGTLRVTCTCRVFTRRSRVRVPRFRRRCAASLVKLGPCGPTLPLRSELAGSGWNYGRRRVMRANVCVNGWRARAPAMSAGAQHPRHSGVRAPCRRFASIVSVKHTLVALLPRRELPGTGKRSAPGASDRDPNGPRPLAGSGRRSRLERGPAGRRYRDKDGA